MAGYHQRDWSGKLVSQPKQDLASSITQPPPMSQERPQQPKKLRFITSNGAPQAKRRRVSTACLTCRKRKVACSGERPHCKTCLNNKLDCTGYSENVPGNDDDHTNPRLVRSETAESSVSKHKRKSIDAGLQQNAPTELNSTQKQSERTQVQTSRMHEGQDLSQRPNPSLFSDSRNRMPYFRWLGPTSISPGFKQMVVKVNRAASTADGVTSPSTGAQAGVSGMSNPSVSHDADARTPQALPFYDNSSMPPSELITHLCETFFTHLACNFPFLQRERFLKDLEEKQVDAILVDAVCALAARFSNHHLLVQRSHDGEAVSPSEQGSTFAQRAKLALIDTFATPSIAAVQAALLIAYNEFGESRDSGLWMYLGIAIRLAQDLGLQKSDGLRYEGREGSSPRLTRDENRNETSSRCIVEPSDDDDDDDDSKAAQDQRLAERERVDTFWAVFFLDRVISSGTGRRSTLQDDDIELSFPPLDLLDPKTGWPSPFPALIRIICLYGRVTDLLNSIKEPSDITNETPQRLADMEAKVTNFYQGLSPKLHFQAMNFHHYVKAGEGTNFVLLHFWFHTLIVLLHQPTLLKTFEGPMLQLFPNSQALSMSSAKTIADILSYSQLIDNKAGFGNPFCTQPIYIAACAFLRETAEQTATSKDHSRSQSLVPSRAGTPERTKNQVNISDISALTHSSGTLTDGGRQSTADRALARHTLLATAASQHYQLCFKALQSLEKYWAGTKYILTVLDQKFKGVVDPLLYTAEEIDGALEPPEPKLSFRSPGWRRKSHWTSSGLNEMQKSFLQAQTSTQGPGTSSEDTNQPIGWTLTGNLNSQSTNVGWHFSSTQNAVPDQQPMETLFETFDFQPSLGGADGSFPQQMMQHSRTYSGNMPRPPSQQRQPRPSLPTFASAPSEFSTFSRPLNTGALNVPHVSNDHVSAFNDFQIPEHENIHPPLGDFLIESQDMDMSLLGLDMLPWFDAPSGDLLPIFDTEVQERLSGEQSHEPQL